VRVRAKRGRRVSGEITRQQLLAAARTIGASKPLTRITVDQITTRAGTSRATFYLYFENRDDIFLHLCREACELLYEKAGHAWSAASPFESIRQATLSYGEAFTRNADVLRLLYTAAPSDARFAALLNSVRDRFLRRIERNLRLGADASLFEPLDPKPTARALGGMVEQFLVTSLFANGELVDVDEAATLLATLWYRAVASKTAASSAT